MVTVHFQSGAEWYKSNWVFRQFAQDVMVKFPENVGITQLMEKAAAFGMLNLASLEPDLSLKALDAIKTTARGIIEGKIPGWRMANPNDATGMKMYLDAVTELLELAERN